jgi:hypothetical protein
MCELMAFQIYTISDVVEVDSVIWVVLDPRHQHFYKWIGMSVVLSGETCPL